MDAFYAPWSGVVTGAGNADDAFADAKAWLTAHDVDSSVADVMLAGAHNLAAHWGGPDVGFVQEHHEDAQPVWVVALPQSWYATHPDPITD